MCDFFSFQNSFYLVLNFIVLLFFQCLYYVYIPLVMPELFSLSILQYQFALFSTFLNFYNFNFFVFSLHSLSSLAFLSNFAVSRLHLLTLDFPLSLFSLLYNYCSVSLLRVFCNVSMIALLFMASRAFLSLHASVPYPFTCFMCLLPTLHIILIARHTFT